jgi:hypothetical protein
LQLQRVDLERLGEPGAELVHFVEQRRRLAV